MRGLAWDAVKASAVGLWMLRSKKHRPNALPRLREAWARHRKNRADKAAAKAAAAAAASAPPAVGSTVRRPTTPTIPATFTGGTPVSGGHHFIAPAMEMARIAANYDPKGMLQVGEDFTGLEEALRLHAEAMKATVENAHGKQPLDPQIIEIMRQIHHLQIKAADLAQELRPAFEKLHHVDLERLRNPRTGERMWDVASNL